MAHSFGLSHFISEESTIYHVSFFDTQHIGRICDVFCVFLDLSRPEEFFLRDSIVKLVFASESFQKSGDPILLEVARKQENEGSLCLAVSFSVTDSDSLQKIGGKEDSRDASTDRWMIELNALNEISHITLKLSQERLQVECDLSFPGTGKEILEMGSGDLPLARQQIHLGDLPYASFLEREFKSPSLLEEKWMPKNWLSKWLHPTSPTPPEEELLTALSLENTKLKEIIRQTETKDSTPKEQNPEEQFSVERKALLERLANRDEDLRKKDDRILELERTLDLLKKSPALSSSNSASSSKVPPEPLERQDSLRQRFTALQQQAEEFKKTNRRLMEKLDTLKRAGSQAGASDTLKKLQIAMQQLAQARNEVQLYKNKLGERS